MTTGLPRLVIAAPATGQGKTTVSVGLMAALRRTGLVVSGHKVGPDYIDPGYHALACGRPGRNLDPHLVGEHRIGPLLVHGARGADVAVVEGVMGLYDGKLGGRGFASTAHVAALTRSPVVLVVDISRASRTVGAVVHGLATYSPDTDIAGVILNRAGSPRHAAEVADSIDLPVLGTLPRDARVSVPSRHLGLVPAAERDDAAHALDHLAEVVAESVDLERVLDVTRSAPDLVDEPWDPAHELSRGATGVGAGPASGRGFRGSAAGGLAPQPPGRGAAGSLAPQPPGRGAAGGLAPQPPDHRRPVVAMAGGRVFTFRYAETEELLRAAGCDVVTFDPLADPALPEGTAGIYLGGGFPEVHAAELTANDSMRKELAAAIADGVPTVAECAGLVYLCESLDSSPMVGAVAARAAMTERLTLRYPTLTATTDTLLTRAGEQVTGHEFHRTRIDPPVGDRPAWQVDGETGIEPVGHASDTLHASYLHTHWAGHPQLARRFAEAVHTHG